MVTIKVCARSFLVVEVEHSTLVKIDRIDNQFEEPFPRNRTYMRNKTELLSSHKSPFYPFKQKGFVVTVRMTFFSERKSWKRF